MDKQTYLKQLLESKFNSELCRKDEADIIICLLQDNGIDTAKLERDYKENFESVCKTCGKPIDHRHYGCWNMECKDNNLPF